MIYRAQLDRLAEATGRSRNFLLNEAVRLYLANEGWQIAQIEEGLHALEGGEIVPEDEMEAFWDRLTALGSS